MGENVAHLLQEPDGSDCTKCGLCCTSPYEDLPFFVEVSAFERDQMPAGFVRRNVVRDRSIGPADEYAIKVKMLRQPKGSPLEGQFVRVCRGFHGALGQKCACSIYEDRPLVCQEWEPRNATCMRIRKKFVEAVLEGHLGEAV